MLSSRTNFIFIVAVALTLQVALSFHEIPHMLILGIAKRDLLQNNPEIYQITEKYFSVFDQIGVYNQTIFEENAIWGDDIKKYGDVASFWNMWHYDGKGIIKPAGFQDPVLDNIVETENINNAWDRIKETLTLKELKGQITEVKVFLLKMLVHIVGDAHMPNHAGTYYSTNMAKGDKGGNNFNIQFNGQKTNIHFFYDSGCFFYNFKKRLQRPTNDTFISYFKGEMDRLMTLHPKESLTTLINPSQNLKDWVKESLDIATTFIYPYFEKTTTVDSDFYNKSFDMIQKQIVLAGYRLAQSLTAVLQQEKGMHSFGNTNPTDPNKPVTNPTDPTKPITNPTDPSKPITNPTDNNKPVTNPTNNQENQQNNQNEYSHDDAVNKSIAIVFGVLFGMTFMSFLAYIIIQKINNIQKVKSESKFLRSTTDLQEARGFNEKKLSTENQA